MADVEPMVWLPGAVQRPPIPEPRQGSATSRARQKDEFHLAEVGCKVEYRDSDSGECIEVKTQEDLNLYMKLENRPQLLLSST